LNFASYEKQENKKTISKINYINKNYEKTGHMMLKNEILLEWFKRLTFSESMFGATELLFFIKENESIDINVKKKSKICIDIYSTIKNIIPFNIHNIVKFNLFEIYDENKTKKVELYDDKFTHKIYEELNEGKYQLSFTILKLKILKTHLDVK
jgi:hypothetical protein